MNASNPLTKNVKPKAPRFQDVSRFTRMINQLDSRDRALNPRRRKRRWVGVLGILFVLYLASFFLPYPTIGYQRIGTGVLVLPVDSRSVEQSEKSPSSGFELPVDSFENLLKKHIHEDLSKTK